MSTSRTMAAAAAAAVVKKDQRKELRRQRGLTLLRVAFALFVFTLPFEVLNLGEWSRSGTAGSGSPIVSLAKLVGYVFFLLTLFHRRLCYGRTPMAFYFFVVYLVVYAVKGLLGAFPLDTLSRLLTSVQMVILLYAGSNLLADPVTRRATFISLGLSCAAFSLLVMSGLTEDASGQGSSAYGVDRVSGLGEDPNTVAIMLALGVLSILCLTLGREQVPPLHKWIGWLVLPAIIYVIVQTGSRGGTLALGAGLLVLGLGERSPGRLLRNMGLMALLLLMLVVFVLNWEPTLSRWEATIYDGKTAGRDALIQEAWKLIVQKPLFGWGPVAADRALGAAFGMPSRGTHNLVFAVLLETGLFGALFYAIGLGFCLRAAWRARLANGGLLSLVLMVTILAANMSIKWDIYKLHWLVLALALGSGQMEAVKRYLRHPLPILSSIMNSGTGSSPVPSLYGAGARRRI